MAINRLDRFGNENIQSIDQIEDYINANYLQLIQDKITLLNIKRNEIEDKINLYMSLNITNKLLIEELRTDVKYTTIVSNQAVAKPLIDELNVILKNLNTLLIYKDVITLNNLDYKQNWYSANKVSVIDGQFNQVQINDPIAIKGAINKQTLTKELNKLEQPPKPFPPLKYLGTDSAGNLIWI